MNINHKFPLILLTGVAIGLAAGSAIHAQQVKPAPGYFVAGLEITEGVGARKASASALFIGDA